MPQGGPHGSMPLSSVQISMLWLICGSMIEAVPGVLAHPPGFIVDTHRQDLTARYTD
jgi:hypothetical protein